MCPRILLLVVTAAVVWSVSGCGDVLISPPSVTATDGDAAVGIGFFYERLAPYGNWIQVAPYGWVWQPHNTPVGWRPYTNGHWVYTDDYGWLWDSDWDWGWAPFHYGRWFWGDAHGWVWVPGYEWGPAWVAWRTGPGYIGWAPLPPQVGWRAGVGLELGHFDLDRGIPHGHWVFVPDRFFDQPGLRHHVLLPSRNTRIFEHTHNATRFGIVSGHIKDFGVPIGTVRKATGRPVPHFHARSVGSVGAAHLPWEHRGEIDIFRPPVRPGPPGLRPPEPSETQRRHEIEHRQMQERQQAEQGALQRRHEAERRAPRANSQVLQRQQEAEQQALRENQQRQLRQLENRQQRERQQFGPRPEQRLEPGPPREREQRAEQPPQQRERERRPR